MKELLKYIIILLAVAPALAQEEEAGELENVEVEIIKDRQIVLPKANRNFEKVPPRPVEPIKPEIVYEFKNLKFSSPDYNPVIRPMRLKQEAISKIYGNYLSAGFGNYSSPFLEGWFNSKRDKNKYIGAHLYHRNFGNGPVDGKNSASSNTQLRLFGKAFTNKTASSAFLNYENLGNYFYGYVPQPTEPDRKNFKQSYNIYSLGGEIENSKPADFSYNLKGGFSYLKDHYQAAESEVALNLNTDYKIDDQKRLIFLADYYIIARKDSLRDAAPRHLLKIKPAYLFSAVENLWLTVGVNAAYENDTLTTKSFHLYPNVNARYQLSKSVEAYAGLTGDMDKVSLHTLARENQWVNSNLDIFHTNRSIEFLGGLKGKFGRKVGFGAGLALTNFKGLYFYKNDFTNRSKFDVVYDAGNTKRAAFFGELSYAHAETVKLSLRGDYYSYSTDKIAEAWHRPKYRGVFNSTFNLYKKIVFNFDFIAQGGAKAYDYEKSAVVELKPALDLGFRTDYYLSKQFAVFVQLNNVLGNQYQIYLNYPVRGLQVLGGVSWSF